MIRPGETAVTGGYFFLAATFFFVAAVAFAGFRADFLAVGFLLMTLFFLGCLAPSEC
jgi:hypothetical protein